MQLVYPQKDLPILRSGELVVAGGSFAGIAAALKVAEAGRKVVLVEPRTYLGREVAAVLAPWVRAEEVPMHGLMRRLLQASAPQAATARSGEIALHMDTVKRTLEDFLLEAGVELLYASQPVGLAWEDGRISGLIVGNKSGRQVVAGRVFVDATETALLARLAGLALEPPARGSWGRNMEFDGLGAVSAGLIPVPEEFGVAQNTAMLHHGYRPGLGILECSFPLPYPLADLSSLSRAEVDTRRRLMRLAAWLVQQAPGFEHSYLSSVANELNGPFAGLLQGGRAGWLDENTSRLLGAFSTPNPALWMLNTAARLDVAGQLDDPNVMLSAASAAEVGEAFGHALAGQWKSILSKQAVQAAEPQQAAPAAEAPVLLIREPESPQRGKPYRFKRVPASAVPVAADVDVLVVGGGTSGALAAYTAAREKAQTCLVEMLPGLGGTGTFGGVHSYWFGYRGGFAGKSRRWVNREQKALGLKSLRGEIPKWNIEAKSYALERQLSRQGVRLLYNAKVIGVVMEGQAVRGIVAATRLGPAAILGRVTIDASGDGDVAAFAGADFQYGSPRDHMVMWYSLAQLAQPGRTRNNFTSTVDISNIEDYNRALISARRRGSLGQDHDHGIYLAPRESRHIIGDVMPTLTDHLLRRAWEDVVCVAFSNNDIKGQISSDWFRAGLIPPHLEIEIPYRALLPKGLENILVVGKAISTTHDALPAVRMQADLENLGGASGLAAALAVKSGTTVRGIDVQALQLRLGQEKVLTRLQGRKLTPLRFPRAKLEQLIHGLSAEKPLYAYSDMPLSAKFDGRIPFVDIVSAGPPAAPILEAELAQERDPRRRVLLAQALALVGSQAGTPVLVETLLELLRGGALPERNFNVRHADRYSPDQAAMPEAANLLFTLAEARDPRAIPVWERVVDLLGAVREEDVWSQRKGIFYYVDAVCCGAEKLGDPAAVPLLLRLHAFPPFQRNLLTAGFQANYLLERAAYLEVVIARALARCASPVGVLTLIGYLQDVRALLAEQAHSELRAISGQDYGKDASAWSQWLEQNSESLQPVPWAVPSDTVVNWKETIYIALTGTGVQGKDIDSETQY